MPRIRTIKPEFFSSRSIVECSTNARLTYIGMWMFGDDYGNITSDPLQIKIWLWPADNIEVSPLLAELESKGHLIPYADENGSEHYHMPTFLKHQKIDRPGKPQCPNFDVSMVVRRQFDEHSTSVRRAFVPDRTVPERIVPEVGSKEPCPKDGLSDDAKSVLDHLNKATGRTGKTAFRACRLTMTHIKARLKEFSVDDLKLMIYFKIHEWANKPDMQQYIQPSTLFGTNKISQYVPNAHKWAESRKPTRPEPTRIQIPVLSPEEDEARRIVHEERCADREAFSARERPYNAIHGPGAYARMRTDQVKAAMKQEAKP